MRKYPCYLLANPEAPPTPVAQRWGRGPVLVLGRQLCVHFSLDATGVPRSSLGGFVALQAGRLSPFARFGGSFVRQGNRVHVWVWSLDVISRALSGLAPLVGNLHVVPESIYGAVPKQGVAMRPCVVGYEALRFEGGLLQDNQWWPQEPVAVVFEAFANKLPVSKAVNTTQDRVRAGDRWARSVRAVPDAGAAEPVGWLTRLQSPVALVMLAWMMLAGAAGYVGWLAAAGQALSQNKSALQVEMDTLLAQSARGAGSQQGKASALDAQWVRDVKRLTAGVKLDGLVNSLAPGLASRGLLIRELVVERDEVKIVLVSGYGGPINLDEAVAALESASLWQRVELLDLNDPTRARFGLKLKSNLEVQP